MSEDNKATRKAKSAAKKAARAERNINPAPSTDTVSPTLIAKIQDDIKTKSTETPAIGVPKIGTPAPMDAKDYVIPNVPEVTAQAEVQNPSDITNTPKLSPWEQMMANRRKSLQQEKTDAAKMQKYYSLTSALKALGDMGATAIGGAIGGKAIDSAPKVEPYQQSKGYIDAFERAKAANEALRRLDDTEFQLKYADEQKAEERAYRAELAKAEREYNAQVAKEERAYRKDMAMLEHELRKAERAENRAEEERIKKEILTLTHAHEEKMKQYSLKMVNEQMSGKNKDADTNTPIPFTFQNLTKVDIPRHLYPELLGWALSKGKIGDEHVDEDNVEIVLRRHPELVNSFLNVYGLGTKVEETPVVEKQTEEKPKQSFWQKLTNSPQRTAGVVIGNGNQNTPEEHIEETGSGMSLEEADKKWSNKK